VALGANESSIKREGENSFVENWIACESGVHAAEQVFYIYLLPFPQ
jgi:hypothetical protein